MPETPDVRWKINACEGDYSSEVVKGIALAHHWPEAKAALMEHGMSSEAQIRKLNDMTLQQGIDWLGPVADEEIEIVAALDVQRAVRYLTKERGMTIRRA